MPLPALSVLPANSRPGVGIGSGIDRGPMMMMRAARAGSDALRRYGSPAGMMGPADAPDTSSFGAQNYLANTQQYGQLFGAGSFGDQNARANAPSPVAMMMQPGEGAPAARTARGAPAADPMAGLTEGERSAMDVENARSAYSRVANTVAPGTPPEEAASRFGAMDLAALRAAGQTPAESSGRPVYRAMDASGRPVLTSPAVRAAAPSPGFAPDQTSSLSPLMAMAGDPTSAPVAGQPYMTAYDRNRAAVAAMAEGARQKEAALVTQQNTPQYYQDPVTGQRRVVLGREMQPSGVDPTAAPEKKTGIEELNIGGQKVYYHHEGKRYFDANGTPMKTGGEKTTDPVKQALADAIAGKTKPGGTPAVSTPGATGIPPMPDEQYLETLTPNQVGTAKAGKWYKTSDGRKFYKH